MKKTYNAPKLTIIEAENDQIIASSLFTSDGFAGSEEQLSKGRLPYNDWDNIWK